MRLEKIAALDLYVDGAGRCIVLQFINAPNFQGNEVLNEHTEAIERQLSYSEAARKAAKHLTHIRQCIEAGKKNAAPVPQTQERLTEKNRSTSTTG